MARSAAAAVRLEAVAAANRLHADLDLRRDRAEPRRNRYRDEQLSIDRNIANICLSGLASQFL